MPTLTEEMKRVLREQRLGFVATVSPDAAPNLSPKGTVRALDDDHLVFVDIRSPQTVRNVGRDPRVEVNVVDPLTRTGYRFAGRASVHRSGDVFDRAVALYRGEGSTAEIAAVVVVAVERAARVTSPVYDTGASEPEVRARWRSYWHDLWDQGAVGDVPGEERAPLTPAGLAGADEWRRGDYVISTNRGRLDLDVVHGFLARSYWSPGIPRATVERAVRHSLSFGVYRAPADGDAGAGAWEQVGFSRVVTDEATFAYLADVFVLEAYRGRGLGVWLVETVSSHPRLQGLRRWVLATRDAHGLYERFGFTPLAQPDRWMERVDPDVRRRSAPA